MPRRRIYLYLSLFYFLGYVSQHENGNRIADRLIWAYGRPTVDHYQVIGEWIALAIFFPLLVRTFRRSREGAKLLVAWVLFAAVLLATEEWVVVKKIEHIHYPQFALQAALFYMALGDYRPAFLLGVAAGALDEAFQFFVSGRVLDVNDIWLNLLGCAFFVIAHRTFRPERQ